MDFKKLKSMNWVGNIYQKFETIRQEVDGIVNQDSIKYVENQVQTVGKSVKKFSSTVQDLLPMVRQKSAISVKSRENVKENSLDVTANQSPGEPNVKNPVRNQLSLVSTENDLADQPNPPTMNTLEVSELSVGKIDEVLANEKSLVAIEKQSPTEPNVMTPVKNQPSLVSSKYHLADQPSSPTLIDTVEVPESDLSVGKVDEVLTSEGLVDATENKSPTNLNAMDRGTNQLSVVSSKYHLPDQPSSPTSMDTLKVSESDLSVGNIEDSFDSTEKQSPMEPNVMDHVTEQLSLVGRKYYLADQSSSPAAVDTLEVLESELSVENTDEVWTNENSLDATENQTPTYPSVIDPYQPGLIFSKYNLAGQLSSPASLNTLEVLESDLSVPEFDDISPESVAEGTPRTAEFMPLTVPSRKKQVQICDSVQYDALKPSLDIGSSDESSSDFSRSSMETIDLHDKVKLEERSVDFRDKVQLEESCVIVDDSVLHTVSSRARKQRSYKKRIQDAFTSKKRLAKEYEQLAIWFGDSHIETSQQTLSNVKSSETDDACDSEWELL
ncbi:hypothetical protein D8674_022561 [Pyrus ussuriensis x Pyrus communis]|uniref:Uncharacterized protein n=1 Tax=Pyrus ussuriensis x Pyrus communis TaxID=2448454 RepID=A0A5N5GME3_9ROSA|nr:hypothetical protein D8674_022561 [Pyrus ussuriensis x Pyrus communis]